MIDRDRLRGITFVVAPSLKLFVYPHCLPNWRVGKTVPECLRTGSLDQTVSGSVAPILAELSERRLFCSGIAAGRRWWRRKKNRKIQMNGGKPCNVLLGHPTRHSGAPIAALCYVVVVTQTSHQDCPCVSNARKAPPSFGRFVR